jgi:transcriptional regulator with XRE-family HTH domain
MIENSDEIASELHGILTTRTENKGSIKEIAYALNLSEATVYSYLYGKIKMSLRFLHAAVEATNGDPDVKKFLEPRGWCLGRSTVALNPSKNWEKELGDIGIATGNLHTVVRESLRDGIIAPSEHVSVRRGIDTIKKELADIESLVGKKR